jgi:hypothetical protein
MDEYLPETYVIDLDAAPRKRYQEIGKHFREQLQELVYYFDEILTFRRFSYAVRFLARQILRKVHDAEEQQEIDGLVEATGIPNYLFVAFNSFLDIMMGCTSGAVKLTQPERNFSDNSQESPETKMLHFRNLDWEMDELRALLIHVRYQRGGETVATAITYAGYVGCLTGVRYECLSWLNHHSPMAG